jgi:DNA repair exonuclease SbcCD ATPase subunit
MKVLLLITAAVALLASASRDAFVLSSPGSQVTCSTVADLTSFQSLQTRFGDDFLWVRRHGKSYVIRDASLLQRTHAFFAAVSALAPAREAIKREEKKIDREEERLDEIADRASDSEDRRAKSAPSVGELREVRVKLEEVRARQRSISERERELDQREDALEQEAERKLWRLVDDAIRSGAALDQR